MTTDDLLANLRIAKSQLDALRHDPGGEESVKRIDAVLHVVVLVRGELERRAREGSVDDGQLELGCKA